MPAFDKLDTFIGGLFKIQGEPFEEVLRFAKELKDNDEGDDFVQLSVRYCTGAKENQPPMVAIDFLYDLDCAEEYAEREHKKFLHKYTDQLRRRFGNGLVAWDVSTPVYAMPM